MITPKKNKPSKGFALIEIIVVSSLAMILLFVIYDIFLLAQKINASGGNQLELVQNGRIVMDRLSREIRQTQEIVTAMPLTNDEIGFPPPAEIEFRDGHDIIDIQYLRYFLTDGQLIRQRKIYYFSSEPENHVLWNSLDSFNNPPLSSVLEEKTIAEYISNLEFYGDDLVNINLNLSKEGINEHFFTSIWGRNIRE